MTIQEILDNILHAVFGRDVRQSLHDGVKIASDICTETEKRQTELEKKYNEQIKNITLESPSDAEIVDARVKPDGTVYETLGKRLNAMDESCDEVTGAKSKADGTTYETLGDRLDAMDAADAEVTNARTKADGTTYETLGERMNAADDVAGNLQNQIQKVSDDIANTNDEVQGQRCKIARIGFNPIINPGGSRTVVLKDSIYGGYEPIGYKLELYDGNEDYVSTEGVKIERRYNSLDKSTEYKIINLSPSEVYITSLKLYFYSMKYALDYVYPITS